MQPQEYKDNELLKIKTAKGDSKACSLHVSQDGICF